LLKSLRLYITLAPYAEAKNIQPRLFLFAYNTLEKTGGFFYVAKEASPLFLFSNPFSLTKNIKPLQSNT